MVFLMRSTEYEVQSTEHGIKSREGFFFVFVSCFSCRKSRRRLNWNAFGRKEGAVAGKKKKERGREREGKGRERGEERKRKREREREK